MIRAASYLKYFALYGSMYWVIDFIFQFSRFNHWIWIVSITIVVPVLMCSAIFSIYIKTNAKQHPVGLPLMSLLGIWVLAPIAIAIEMIPIGGKFFEQGSVELLLQAMLFFPISTIHMSTYSGSLGGLMLVTILLPIFSVYLRKRKMNNIEVLETNEVKD
jgi:hypothetical protein